VVLGRKNNVIVDDNEEEDEGRSNEKRHPTEEKNKKTLERCQGRRKLTRCTLGLLELESCLLVGSGAIS
jgi:hypothetical protein